MLIKKAASVIAYACEGNPDGFGRWGGDEFLVIFHNNGALADFRRRFREELKRQADESDLPVAFSISSGYAVHEPDSEDSIDMIISRADNEMYIQKAASHAARPDSI